MKIPEDKIIHVSAIINKTELQNGNMLYGILERLDEGIHQCTTGSKWWTTFEGYKLPVPNCATPTLSGAGGAGATGLPSTGASASALTTAPQAVNSSMQCSTVVSASTRGFCPRRNGWHPAGTSTGMAPASRRWRSDDSLDLYV